MDLLEALIVILVISWVLGISLASSLGYIIHILLIVAVIMIVFRLLRKPVTV